MTAQDWVIVLGAVAALVGAVATAAVKVIQALRENTAVTVANTLDRATKTATTNAKLDAITDAVTSPPAP